MARSLLTDISVAVGLSPTDVMKIVETAPNRYKVYAIPKRSGIGARIIAQPARELKNIQRYLIADKLNALPIHPAATAYRRGSNIGDNARAHSKNRVILKLDFRNFFHSLIFSDLEAALNNARFDAIARDDWKLLEKIFFWYNPITRRLCLSIGAPSSPFLSNAIMEKLDRAFFAICKRHLVVYTRYADDLTLSSNAIEKLTAAETEIRKTVKNTRRPKLIFNDEKRGIYTTAGRRLVTGLVITPDGKVSLGRDRKRKISVAIHHIATGENTRADHVGNTKGWLAYALSVEPTFVASMIENTGAQLQIS